MRQRGHRAGESEIDFAADQRHDGRRPALVRDMYHRDAGYLLEHFHRQVIGRAGAARACVELAGLPFRQRHELGHRPGRHAGMHDQELRRERDLPHGREILHRVERDLLEQDRIGRELSARKQYRVAVGRRPHGELGANNARRAAAVIHHELLPHAFLEPLA